MIDRIIANPWVSQNELAAYYGYTVGWVSQVIASDAFQSRLAERKNELIDPTIRATIEERFKGLVIQSLEVLRKKLESPGVSDKLAIQSLDVAAKALGYGAKNVGPTVQANFVVQVPGKAASSEAWVEAHTGISAERPPIESAAIHEDAPPANEGDALLEELERAI
jgi:hypothetical protein